MPLGWGSRSRAGQEEETDTDMARNSIRINTKSCLGDQVQLRAYAVAMGLGQSPWGPQTQAVFVEGQCMALMKAGPSQLPEETRKEEQQKPVVLRAQDRRGCRVSCLGCKSLVFGPGSFNNFF